jgi:hypothetical protein
MSETSEQRQSILQMLAAGKVSVEDAAAMIRALDAQPGAEADAGPVAKEADAQAWAETVAGPTLEEASPEAKEGGPRWLHVHVSDLRSGQRKVTVNVPLRMLQFGMRVGSRFAPEMEGLNWKELAGMISSEKGMLVEVKDEEDGEHVQVFVD